MEQRRIDSSLALEEQKLLREEIDTLRDRVNRLVQVEAKAEVYAAKLKDIPELKAKLKEALEINLA